MSAVVALATLLPVSGGATPAERVDWLRAAVPAMAQVSTGTIEGGIRTLTLGNGLISRTFTLPPGGP